MHTTFIKHWFHVFLLLTFILISSNISAQNKTNTEVGSQTMYKKHKFSDFIFGQKNNDTTPRQKLNLSLILLLTPKDYKVFDNDPIDLFTRTGLHVGVNILYRIQPSKPDSLGWLQMISANYGVTRGAFNLEYLGIFHQLIGPWDFLLKSRFDDPAVENYFGTGNETIKPKSRTYNRTKSTRFYFGAGINQMLAEHHHAELSIFYQTIKVKKTSGHFISESPKIDSSIFSNKQFIGADAGYHYRKTNDNNFPTKGIDFLLGLGYINTLKEKKSLAKILSSFSFYLPLGRSFSFATRIGGATQSSGGDYYHLSKLGGYVNLRGYLRERFYGKTTFYNNNEFRWVTPARISRYSGRIGLLAFFDEGRVWQPGEVSNTVHIGYGGGLIVIPANKIALTGTVAHSKESSVIEVKAGMFF